MQIRLPKFNNLLNLAAERFIAEYADQLPPALRLLPPSPTCRPTPIIDRPAARARYAGRVIYVTFG